MLLLVVKGYGNVRVMRTGSSECNIMIDLAYTPAADSSLVEKKQGRLRFLTCNSSVGIHEVVVTCSSCSPSLRLYHERNLTVLIKLLHVPDSDIPFRSSPRYPYHGPFPPPIELDPVVRTCAFSDHVHILPAQAACTVT